MKIFLPLLVSLFSFSTYQAFATPCISAKEENRLLATPFQSFDQAEQQGWRIYADMGCYAESASLLNKYYDLHKTKLNDMQTNILIWHAGQMYAFDYNYVAARSKFLNTFKTYENDVTTIVWNNYVSATISFLDKDFGRLLYYRDRLIYGPMFPGAQIYVQVANNLVNCFQKPYAEAYMNCRQ